MSDLPVSAEDVKRLRELTGAGMMDCKRALQEANGDFDRAQELLRERGQAGIEKRKGRTASNGMVESYVHGEGRIGVLVELNCETDFVARTDSFRALARDIAMQVAAMDPLALMPEDVPADAAGTPEERALLTQAFIRDGSKNIQQMVQDVMASTGENIKVSRFSRFELGRS